MARDFDGSSTIINWGNISSIDDINPWTAVAWVYCDAHNQEGAWSDIFTCVADDDSYEGRYFLYIENDTDYLTTWHNVAAGNPADASEDSAFPTGSWQHVAARLNWGVDNTPDLFRNGSEVSYSTHQAGTGTLSSNAGDDLAVASEGTSSGWVPFDGRICDVGLWNAYLTTSQIAALGAGVSPLCIEPHNLAFYAPLWGRYAAEPCLITGVGGTVTDAAYADHYKTIYVPGQRFFDRAVAPDALTGSGAGALTYAGASSRDLRANRSYGGVL